jgi:hypothetical protein
LARIGKAGTGLADATLAALVDTAFQFSIERNLALRRGVFRAGALRERGIIIAAQGRWAKALGRQAQRLSYVKAGGSILAAAGTAGLLSAPSPLGVPVETTRTAGIQSGFFTSPVSGQRIIV